MSAAAIGESLSVLEAYDFPDASTVEVVKALKPWRRYFTKTNELAPIYLRGYLPYPDRPTSQYATKSKPGYLRMLETKAGYRLAPVHPRRTASPDYVLLDDGTVGIEASTARDFNTGVSFFDFGSGGVETAVFARAVATTFTFAETGQDFPDRDCLGVWEHTVQPLAELDEETLDVSAKKLAGLVRSLNLIEASAGTV